MPSLTELLFPGIHPDLWACPVQQGIPFFVTLVMNWMTMIAAIVFLYGVVSSSIGYMTAFGNEDKVKKAKLTLQWTIIGAVVIILSAYIVGIVTTTLLPDNANTDFNAIPPTANCLSPETSDVAKEASFWEKFDAAIKKAIKEGQGR